MATVIRYCVLEEEHIGENVFICHRPFPFGNPFIIGNKKSRFKGLICVDTLDECLDLYDKYFDRSISENEVFKKEWERLIEACEKYDTVYLGCYCPLNKKCHTDIIKNKISRFFVKKHIQNLLSSKKN